MTGVVRDSLSCGALGDTLSCGNVGGTISYGADTLSYGPPRTPNPAELRGLEPQKITRPSPIQFPHETLPGIGFRGVPQNTVSVSNSIPPLRGVRGVFYL